MTTATITDTCTAVHPYFEVQCVRPAHPAGKHIATAYGKGYQWGEPSALVNHPDLAARKTNPASSHQAAQRGFGIPRGVKGMSRDILTHVGLSWMTCREIGEAIFGLGPYTYDEAVGLNKVNTICLKLYREGFMERREVVDELLSYRRRA
jgi:hypothetical protein